MFGSLVVMDVFFWYYVINCLGDGRNGWFCWWVMCIFVLICFIVVILFFWKVRIYWWWILFILFWLWLVRFVGKVVSNWLNILLMICVICCICGFLLYCFGMLLVIWCICLWLKLIICVVMFFIDLFCKFSLCLLGWVLVCWLLCLFVVCYGWFWVGFIYCGVWLGLVCYWIRSCFGMFSGIVYICCGGYVCYVYVLGGYC